MPLSDLVGMFGSDAPPRAILNRHAAPIQGAGKALATSTLRAIRPDIAAAFDTYMAGQGKQEGLAADQEGTLRTLLARRLADDPQTNLENIFRTAFSQIDPNVIAPLARFDVNTGILANRARGISPGAIDSTAERLRNARVASGRYYDVARNVYNVVPQLFNSAYAQGQANDASAAGFIPQISAGYEAVSSRPFQAIMNRLRAVAEGQGVESRGIANAVSATQGYQQPQNFADKFSKMLKADEKAVMDIAQMALSLYSGGALGGAGGAGGGLGGLMKMFGGGGSGGTPQYGVAPGSGGMNL